jgi:ketosteroid isomerase-like protein
MVAPLSNLRSSFRRFHVSTRSRIWGSLALVLIVNAVTTQTATAGADEQAVTAGEHEWLKSQQTNNVELLAPLLADKVVETTEEGKVYDGKAAVLAAARSDTWSSVEYTDLKVTVFGHAAIATGTFTGKGMTAGKPVDAQTRFTDTWVMTNGKWLCVATHTSPIKK